MGRHIERLSARFVEHQKKPGYYCDGAGLYLQLSESGAKSWIYRYTRLGRTREMGLGSRKVLSLAEAREEAARQRKVLAAGLDPIEVRDKALAETRAKAANSIPFLECAEKYIDAHKAGWKNEKHIAQWRMTLTDYAGEVLGTLPVSAVETAHIVRVLEPLWTKKPETASRLRGRIERVLDWARVRGYRSGDNPARWRGHLEALLPRHTAVKRVEHHPALPYGEIALFMAELHLMPGNAARALELAILTAVRSGEVRGAKPEEFDLEAAEWTIPAERMKLKRPHRVPLSPRAVELLRQQLREEKDARFVFPNPAGEALSDMALLRLLDRMARKDITVHGFRSTFKDWAAETTSYANEVSEMALAHAIGNDVEAAYRRGDLFEKRRRLMEDWGKFCSRRPIAGTTVTPIRKSVNAGA